MKIMSVNMHNLGERAKKLSLKRFVDMDRSNVVFLQEMMGNCDVLINEWVKLFSGFVFHGLDLFAHYGGIITII